MGNEKRQEVGRSRGREVVRSRSQEVKRSGGREVKKSRCREVNITEKQCPLSTSVLPVIVAAVPAWY